MSRDDLDEVNVPEVPEPDEPEEGVIDPADDYSEGVPYRWTSAGGGAFDSSSMTGHAAQEAAE